MRIRGPRIALGLTPACRRIEKNKENPNQYDGKWIRTPIHPVSSYET